MKQGVYFTTRPTLASYLFSRGFKGERVTNIYDQKRGAWEFIKSPELEQAVKSYTQMREQNKSNG